jgi:hypothetical protein
LELKATEYKINRINFTQRQSGLNDYGITPQRGAVAVACNYIGIHYDSDQQNQREVKSLKET